MKKIIAALWLVLGCALPAQQPAPQNSSIRKEEMKADLYFLAGDLMRGRLTGTQESDLAADWVRSRFERLGLKPAAGGGSYFQTNYLMVATLGGSNRLEVFDGRGARQRLRMGLDYYAHRFGASGAARGELVFAGFGIRAPHLSYDDYPGDAVQNKIVLVLDHEPGENDPASPFDGVVSSEPSVPFRKVLEAQEKGAAAILFVSDVHNHPEPRNFEAEALDYWPPTPPRIERYWLAKWLEPIRIPALQISPAAAQNLLRGTGRSLEELSRSAESTGGTKPIAIPGVELEIETSVNRHIVPDRNVLAMIEGADPRLKDECILVCAHYDHNGADGAEIFNGADDDGSGMVGLLEIAEAYALAARAGQRPRRSLLFAAWGAEERGPLMGSWGFAEGPTWPLDKIASVLNMDMIGRSEEVPDGGGRRFRGLERQTAESNRNTINVLGQSRSPDLKAAIEGIAGGFGLELKMLYDNNVSQLLRRSDQWPFLQHGIPALFFHTGLHPDYHTRYDIPEKIQYDKMENIVRMIHQLSWNLAQQDSRPRFAGKKYLP